ncbi:NAD-dependent epimerase/dehydratase family protein [Pseudahrensia aquimaris]|uniref:NAD-dependent epimerase/dehydratase family protein n=1 Tax=Pseudahrensia aquimaris TaxID=744461 RepID=A0ABW3FE77_9HYPH
MGRVLVTGATGFLGGSLVRSLVTEKVDVIATGRNEQLLVQLPMADCNRFVWDMAEPMDENLLATLGGVTAIVHCAAYSSAWGHQRQFWSANVDGTQNCLDLASKLNVRHFVHVSTPAVYFKFEDQIGIRETQPLPKPINAYAETKAIAEQRVRDSGVPFSILRPRGIYGAGDTALLPRLLKAAATGPLPRFRNGAAKTDITYVEDVVFAIMATLNAGTAATGEVFNVSGGDALPIGEIVEKACAASGTRVRWRNLPVAPALAAVRLGEGIARLRKNQPEPRVTAYGLGIFAYSQTLDISKAQRLLNWQPRISFDEGLSRTFSEQSA